MPSGKSTVGPIETKLHLFPSNGVLVVRTRPKVANGGGFVAADSSERVVFRVDGCGFVGRKEEMILRDGDGNALLDIRRNGSMVEALSMRRQWTGTNCESHKMAFTLKESKNSYACLSSNRISIECHGRSFQVRGDFPSRCCSIVDSRGDIVAQIGFGADKEEKQQGKGMDVYGVEIKGGIMEEAFVFGIIAVLDCIYDGSIT